MAEEQHRPGGGERQGFSPTPKQIVAAVLGVVLIIFVAQNTGDTQVSLLTFDISAPLWVILAITIAVSLLIGILIGTRRAKPSKRSKK